MGITLGTTFLVWVIIDPMTGLLEMLLPESRKHRIERLAQAKAQREKRQKDRERLLAKVLAKEESDQSASVRFSFLPSSRFSIKFSKENY